MSRRARTRAAATAIKRMYLDASEPLRDDDDVDLDEGDDDLDYGEGTSDMCRRGDHDEEMRWA